MRRGGAAQPLGIRGRRSPQAPPLLPAVPSGYAEAMRTATTRETRLPILELLGRSYSEEQWEALCNRCGECCYESEWRDNRWVSTGVPCRYLDVESNHCKVYTCRFEAEPQCNRVTPSSVMQGMLPEACTYVDELQAIIGEDFDGHDPRLRGHRRRKKQTRIRGRRRRR